MRWRPAQCGRGPLAEHPCQALTDKSKIFSVRPPGNYATDWNGVSPRKQLGNPKNALLVIAVEGTIRGGRRICQATPNTVRLARNWISRAVAGHLIVFRVKRQMADSESPCSLLPGTLRRYSRFLGRLLLPPRQAGLVFLLELWNFRRFTGYLRGARRFRSVSRVCFGRRGLFFRSLFFCHSLVVALVQPPRGPAALV